MDLQLGKIYTFVYESKTPTKSKHDPVGIVMGANLKRKIKKYIKDNGEKILKRFEEMCKMSEDIKNTKDKALQEELKEEFKEKFSGIPKEEQTPDYKAQNIFFRNYNPNNMVFVDDDDAIKAIFGGWGCTINGVVTYKWYVISPIMIERDKITEDIAPYIEILEKE